MKIYTLAAEENWICDRFTNEWNKQQRDVVIHDPVNADIIWLLASWRWRHIQQFLYNKKVVATIHHIDESKFDQSQYDEFMARDEFVNVYHVPCRQTQQFVTRLTKKPIFIQPFWVNQKLWFPIDKKIARSKFEFDNKKFLIGSFQRDTEGFDLVTPKLSKGPDVFVDVVAEFHKNKKFDVEVVLAGWRRQYVMKRLTDLGIKFHYIERPDDNVINLLYNTLDLYIVGSRCEGGPQAIVECAATQTPIISTPVGLAENILGGVAETNPQIFHISEDHQYPKITDRIKHCDTNANFTQVLEYFMMNGMNPFLRLFVRLNNE